MHRQSISADVVFRIWSSKSSHLPRGPGLLLGGASLELGHLSPAVGLGSRWGAAGSAKGGEWVNSREQRMGMK